jgi:hypothetical protein
MQFLSQPESRPARHTFLLGELMGNIIWILLLVSGNGRQIFVNSFDSEQKCKKRLEIMDKSYQKQCIKTILND